MNILTSTLPDFLTISGQKCKIRADFKTWLTFSSIVSNGEINAEKAVKICALVFYELPPNFNDAFREILKFYRCETDEPEESHSASSKKQLFSFEYDADMIYSAFYQQYHIDLQATNMHWWQFKALFNGLNEDTQFIKVIGYRNADLSEIKNTEMRKFYGRMKKLYKLPDNRSEAEKEDALNDVFSASFG